MILVTVSFESGRRDLNPRPLNPIPGSFPRKVRPGSLRTEPSLCAERSGRVRAVSGFVRVAAFPVFDAACIEGKRVVANGSRGDLFESQGSFPSVPRGGAGASLPSG